MTAREFVATLRRRWYVLAIVALCTLVGAVAVHKRHVDFQACDVLFVNPPTTSLYPNVYTNQADSVDAMTGVATRAVMSSAVEEQIQSQGLTASYDAEMTNTGTNEDPTYDEPSLTICSTSKDPNMALRTTAAATGQFQAILNNRQAAQGAPRALRMTSVVIASPIALPITGRPSQAYLGVLFMGLVAGIAVTLWSDPLLERRQRRKLARQRPGTAAEMYP